MGQRKSADKPKIESLDDALELLDEINAQDVADAYEAAEICESIDDVLRNLHDLKAAASVVERQADEAIARLRVGRY